MSESTMQVTEAKQLPWTGEVPPHGAEFVINAREIPAGRLVTFTCPACGATLGAFILGNPKSKLQPEWWKCPKGCRPEPERLDA